MYVCMYVCMHVCMYVCMYACMHIHIYTYLHAHTLTHSLSHTHVFTCARARTHTHTHIGDDRNKKCEERASGNACTCLSIYHLSIYLLTVYISLSPVCQSIYHLPISLPTVYLSLSTIYQSIYMLSRLFAPRSHRQACWLGRCSRESARPRCPAPQEPGGCAEACCSPALPRCVPPADRHGAEATPGRAGNGRRGEGTWVRQRWIWCACVGVCGSARVRNIMLTRGVRVGQGVRRTRAWYTATRSTGAREDKRQKRQTARRP